MKSVPRDGTSSGACRSPNEEQINTLFNSDLETATVKTSVSGVTYSGYPLVEVHAVATRCSLAWHF